LGHGVFLLEVTPVRLATAGVIGAAGAVLVELTHRSVAALIRVREYQGGRASAAADPPY
ncbi:MAG: hypothetical protein QOF34_590, partial [Sphingomonadales bacterium]|nr:hypothetical protein [Sphingomonadales bacterium]